MNGTGGGAYTITTAAVNGVTFTSTGTFTTTGLQNVILTGTGTPTNSGSQNFSVTSRTSVCNFPITFAAVTDYFPTTVNSFWDLGLQGGTTADSIKIKVINYTLSAGANSYSTFTVDNIPASGSPDSMYYRKPGGDYIEYFNTQALFFDGPGTPPNIEYIFLKDNVGVGTSWQSQTFSGPLGGVTYTLSLRMTLTEKVTTLTTVGSLSSSAILKVK